ncbi:MAG TPA: hypothetical protein VF194_01285 [Ferrovibrio sp.]
MCEPAIFDDVIEAAHLRHHAFRDLEIVPMGQPAETRRLQFVDMAAGHVGAVVAAEIDAPKPVAEPQRPVIGRLDQQHIAEGKADFERVDIRSQRQPPRAALGLPIFQQRLKLWMDQIHAMSSPVLFSSFVSIADRRSRGIIAAEYADKKSPAPYGAGPCPRLSSRWA